MQFEFNRSFAAALDAKDPLREYRRKFAFPHRNGKPLLYFTGNSLGLQPLKAREYLQEELDDWAEFGVEGHIASRRPWVKYHEFFTEGLAEVCGAKSSEVVAMNGLTTNLHLLMVSFYRPKGKRRKIICEGKAFPSDQYALKSQLRFHGLDPDNDLIEIMPGPDTHLISTEQILEAVEQHKDELALLMMGGVNYYSGQYFDIPRITRAVHEAGGMAGWDLAHAAGNVILKLHEWEVDFAAWCGYKYLNSGPGGVSGIFIHEKHHGQRDIPRFEGWWGHDKQSRFHMPERFNPIPTAEAWQLSNAPVFAMAPLLASLELFQAAGMTQLRAKGDLLTAYMEYVIKEVGGAVKIITPENPRERGCQLSVEIPGLGKKAFDALSEAGVIADWREPAVIRLAPVPLYNSFTDIYEFGEKLKAVLAHEAI